MYHLDSQQLSIGCTPNHKLYVKKRDSKVFEFIEARDVFGKRMTFKKDVNNIYPNYHEFNTGHQVYPMGMVYLT